MNYVSLFTGAGGGDLAFQHLLKDFKCIGYVEIDEYCQKSLRQRQLDGILPRCPIYTDIKTFISSGRCELFRGITDVISAGFPCQPFSVAGKQCGADDERNMWPETIECIRRIRPRKALLENVPGLFAHEYIRRIFGDLAEARYDARWCTLGADDVGAPHRRKRVWIVAESKSM